MWHEDVTAYDVVRDGARIGRIYLDLHAREGKYKHAAQFPLKDGVRGVQHLQYESFVYGNKTQSSLTDFKRSNGFARIDVPRYYVPLTWKGAAALRLGLHRDQKDRLPAWLRTKWPELRTNLYRRMYRSQAAAAQAR